MNSEPLSESTPNRRKGKPARILSSASCTATSLFPSRAPDSVQPRAHGQQLALDLRTQSITLPNPWHPARQQRLQPHRPG
jgi:hypothetical protein